MIDESHCSHMEELAPGAAPPAPKLKYQRWSCRLQLPKFLEVAPEWELCGKLPQ